MTKMPAFCDFCGTIFGFDLPFGFGGPANITFSGCNAGPCPVCGSMGRIPDGVYNLIGQTLELLSGPSRTVEEIKKLAQILSNAKENKVSVDDIQETLQQELPQFSSLSSLLPKNRTELYTFVQIIIAIIAILVPLWKNDKEPPKIEINQVINEITQHRQGTTQGNKSKTRKKRLPPQRPISIKSSKKIGRNELCPCGSGKKYKLCHMVAR